MTPHWTVHLLQSFRELVVLKQVILISLLLGVVGLSVLTVVWRPVSTSTQQSGRSENELTAMNGFQAFEQVDGKTMLVTHSNSKGTVMFPKKLATTTSPLSETSPGYLGTKACAECHQEKYKGFIETSHHITTVDATVENSIHGSFQSGRNRLNTDSSGLYIEMTSNKSGFHQRVHFHGLHWRYRFDLVTGSGKIGQTYLHWVDDQLFQMHVSYDHKTNRWINSPGYVDGEINYARPIAAECLNCHATYFQEIPGTPNRYHKSNFILGISCERCHAAGRDHVDYHREHPHDDTPRHIVNPADLPADRVNDICSQCHSGTGTLLKPAFRFHPGDKLEEYLRIEKDDEEAEGGVHVGDEFSRLRKSLCFTESETMTCVNCHNPHQFERGNLALFSNRCIKCHPADNCGMSKTLGQRIVTKCIDCHMPKRETHTPLNATGETSFAEFRDHHIKVYTDETERVLMQMEASDDGS